MEGFFMALLTPLFWGSWPVPMRFARRRQVSDGGASFSVFYYFFTNMITLSLVAISLLFGGTDMFHVFTIKRAGLGMTAGVCWQTGNMLLAMATQLAGPAFAFCASGCISVTLGTCLTYWIQPQGDVAWLLCGVLCALTAVCVIFEMHRVKDRALKSYNAQLLDHVRESTRASPDVQSGTLASARGTTELSRTPQKSTVFFIVLCSGICVGMYNPINTLAVMRGADVAEDAEVLLNHGIFWLGLGVFFGAQITLPTFRKLMPSFFGHHGTDEQCQDRGGISKAVLSEFSHTSLSAAALSLFAGVCWACGFLSNMIGGHIVGFALSFALSQTCPLIASFWGLLIFGEFSGPWVPIRAKILLVVELLLYVASMGCLLMCRLAE